MRVRLLAVAMLVFCCSTGRAGTQVHLSGAVTKPGAVTLEKPHPRISDAALVGKPLPQAYMLGAAWLRPGLVESQQRLKAGVLFDLASLRKSGDPAVAAMANQLHHWVASLPVTGRRIAVLDPRVVEINPGENHPLTDGDTLYYPLRPESIRIVGAVQHACSLPLVALQDARLYLPACPASKATDIDNIYVIEPDGHVFVQGIALWNRADPINLAPGAIIYVPLKAGAAEAVDPTLNADVAKFLATQLLPAAETP